MTLAIQRERTTGSFVVRLIGDFEVRMAGAVTQAIVSGDQPSVVIDLTELRSLDAGGLGALVEARRQLASSGRAMAVRGARGEVVTAMRSVGLEGTAGEALNPREHLRPQSVRD